MTSEVGKPLVSQPMLLDAMLDVLEKDYDFTHLVACQAVAAVTALAGKRAKHSFVGDATQVDEEEGIPF